ncbi:DUF6415 family natural product biosynthesis protein [Streptomyces sp. NRRL S-813]|uniref:DUF6415 family natural product biosynthesis protein n=1 Tax=Streptomyces sp. NRRL S-813 TaxID=1463919 RepID=UPI0007C7E4EA|nr:DUF6415 family natural product biosynthesis protein [Streptomyces sp. NRRL S-813]
MLSRIRRWEPFDGDALLEDVGAVLDDCIPAEHVDELAQRLRGHLMRLVDIAVATGAERGDTATAGLVERARAVRCEAVPGDRWKAVGYLRRMGWTVQELHERLVAADCLREAA